MIRDRLDVDRLEVIQVLTSLIFCQHFDVGFARQGSRMRVRDGNHKSQMLDSAKAAVTTVRARRAKTVEVRSRASIFCQS